MLLTAFDVCEIQLIFVIILYVLKYNWLKLKFCFICFFFLFGTGCVPVWRHQTPVQSSPRIVRPYARYPFY
jgi:hypothetical protein